VKFLCAKNEQQFSHESIAFSGRRSRRQATYKAVLLLDLLDIPLGSMTTWNVLVLLRIGPVHRLLPTWKAAHSVGSARSSAMKR
jgi:hypothetical protein